eukprot:2191294-Amphidinium_carterae.1
MDVCVDGKCIGGLCAWCNLQLSGDFTCTAGGEAASSLHSSIAQAPRRNVVPNPTRGMHALQ